MSNIQQKEHINLSTDTANSHAQRYVSLISLTRDKQANVDYQSAIYLLSLNSQIFETVCRYVDHNGIDFARIKRSTMDLDESEKLVIDIAHNLFSYNSNCKATPFEISRLCYPLIEEVYNALKIAGGNIDIVIKKSLNNEYELVLDDSRYHDKKRITDMFKTMISSSEIMQNPQIDKQIDQSLTLSSKLEQAQTKANKTNSDRYTVINKKEIDKNL